MSSNDISIRITNLSKRYEIYDTPRNRLKQFILPQLNRLTSKSSKQYFREFWPLKDISFQVKRGETLGIIGCNGSGKSTLLQIICGILTPTCGSVETYGRVAALLELGSGFNPEFTGRENIYMNASVLGLSNEQIEERFDDIVAFADIGKFVEQPVKTYSSGMTLRLAFAVIAHIDADILIIDEALAVGDAFFIQKCMRFLRTFMENGTVLFVSHDTGAIINLCDKAMLLNQGKMIEIGAPKDIAAHYLATMHKSNQEALRNNIDHLKNQQLDLDNKVDRKHTYSSNENENTESNQLKSNLSEFGEGGAEIVSVKLQNNQGESISLVTGNDDLILSIQFVAHRIIRHPVVGFQIKDRLGQAIFADNSFLTYQLEPLSVAKGSNVVAKFKFCLPILPVGDYSMTAAIAEFIQNTHIQLHWIHDALAIKSQPRSICYGLVGIPMKEIKLSTSS